MVDKKKNNKKTAHMIFKRLKACGFNVEEFKKKFNPTDYERNCYNSYYGNYGQI